MGRFTHQTDEVIGFMPWNFFYGGIERNMRKELKKKDHTFLGFDTEKEMDIFFNHHYWGDDDGK